MNMRNVFVSPRNTFNSLLAVLAIAIFGASLVGCGSGMQMSGPTPAKTTQVVVLLTSTANDQLAIFNVALASIALTDTTGKSTTIFTGANPQFGTQVEWMHLSGASEPLVTVSVPQGTYTAATVTTAGCAFTNVTFAAPNLTTATFDEVLCGQGTGVTTVNLSNPITVGGSVMALSLNLQVPQSFTLNGTGATTTYTISPTFNLTPVSIAAEPTDEMNGKAIDVAGQVTSLNMNGSSFTALTTDGISLTLSTNTSTTFQGIAAFSSLSANLLVHFDAAIQSDGSLLATRVEVADVAAPQESIGPYSIPAGPTDGFVTLLLESNGCANSGAPFCNNLFQFNSNTAFNISQQFSNVTSLPFFATFNSANFLQGQNISVFAPPALNETDIPIPTTITLRPQTVNGTVTAISSDAGFTTYTVTLASYDLFPVLQLYVPNLPFPHPTSPATIVVYADTSAKFLNSGGMVNVGNLLRFKGLVFFDNGAMRMDASEIYDGVTE
jgi:hypothetical protein